MRSCESEINVDVLNNERLNALNLLFERGCKVGDIAEFEVYLFGAKRKLSILNTSQARGYSYNVSIMFENPSGFGFYFRVYFLMDSDGGVIDVLPDYYGENLESVTSIFPGLEVAQLDEFFLDCVLKSVV
jgi:hypothetical protein